MKKVVDVLMVLCVVAVIGFTIYSFYEGGTSVCTADGAQECPAIYENKIVWEDHRNGSTDIYMYDLESEKEIPICTVEGRQIFPAIYEDLVVWLDMRDNPVICAYDLENNKEMALCDTKGEYRRAPNIHKGKIILYFPGPKIYGDKIVFYDIVEKDGDIYMFDLEKERKVSICTVGGAQVNPAIYEDMVVWQDYRNGNWDIYACDLDTGKEISICTAKENQQHPSIYENTVVWEDHRNRNPDIYMFDLDTGKEKLVCYSRKDQICPAIYENTVVWMDKRGGHGADIYMTEI